jgi:hypothetical protein
MTVIESPKPKETDVHRCVRAGLTFLQKEGPWYNLD